MKRITKKIIIVLLASLFFTQNVNATFTRGNAYPLVDTNDYVDYIYNNIGWGYHTNRYYITNDQGNAIAAYCMDPGFGTSSITSTLYYSVSRYLVSDENRQFKARDYGLLKILEKNTSNGCYDGNYGPVTHAVRMYLDAIGWGYEPTTEYQKKAFRSYMGAAYNAINYGAYASAYTSISSKNLAYMTSRNYGEAFNAEGDMATAISYLRDGIDAAFAYQVGGVFEPSLSASLVANIEGPEDNSRIIIVSLTASNLEPFNVLNNINATFTGHDSYSLEGYSDTYSTDLADYRTITSSTRIGTNPGTETLYFAYLVRYTPVVTASGTTSNADMTFTYKTGRNDYHTGTVLKLNGYTGLQRFVAYETGDLTGTLYVPIGDAGGGPDDEPCSPEFDIPSICSDDAEVDPGSNTVKFSFKEGYKNGELQILKCIVDNKDSEETGNSYQLKDSENAGVVEDNPYCAVYCKEDYEFALPYKQQVENGRYFRINVSIKGQQDCYLSKLNTEKFEDDMIAAQQEVVDKYNEYLMYKQLASITNQFEFDNHKQRVGEALCYEANCRLYYPTASYPDYECAYRGSNFYDGINTYTIDLNSFAEGYYDLDAAGNIISGEAPYFDTEFGYGESDNYEGDCNLDWRDRCELIDFKCELVDAWVDYRDNYLDDYIDAIDSAKRDLLNAVEKLRKKVDQYNGCMGDHESHEVYAEDTNENTHFWDMIYDFDPEIIYSYDEPKPNNINTPKWIEEVKNKQCNGKTCDVMQAVQEGVQSEYCGSSTNCTTTDTVELIDGTESLTTEYCREGNLDLKTYNCSNPETDVTYSTKEYFGCWDDGAGGISCGKTEYQITDMSYVHKVAVSQGEYDTARVYYSRHTDGSIKIFDLDASSSDTRNYDQVRGLPVGINTPQGTYFYILTINNIGKYYSDGSLGRIYGTNSDSLSNNLTRTVTQTINGDEVPENGYACTYVVSENTCTDSSGNIHDLTVECSPDETIDSCKLRVCPTDTTPGGHKYCVKEAESYYVCTTQGYSADNCEERDTREQALTDAGCTPGMDCEYNYSCCPNCTVLCVGKCIWHITTDENSESDSSVKFLMNFRAITPARVNINDRQMGYNWDINNAANILVARKAANTISEIEARANVNNVESMTQVELQEVEDYDFKVTLTPNLARQIRDYNRDMKTEGSYNNDTMECYDYEIEGHFSDMRSCENAGYAWKNNKCYMQNIFCYSNFITQMISWDSNAVPAEIQAKRNKSLTAFQNYAASKFNKLPSQETQIVTNDYWTIYVYNQLDVNGDGVPDIGPSWK